MDTLPCIADLPRDETDTTYVKAFECRDAGGLDLAVQFFNHFGFVVISSVFSAEECAATRNAMWEILEAANPEFRHYDYSTWDKLKAKGSYGLSMRGPSFHPTLVNNRQNPKLAKVLHALVTSTSPNDPELADVRSCNGSLTSTVSDLMVSQDRFTVYRATVLPTSTVDIESVSENAAGSGVTNASQFSTGDRNIHLDMNPWWWLEASTDVTDGVATLQYKYTPPPLPPSAVVTSPSQAAESTTNELAEAANALNLTPADGTTGAISVDSKPADAKADKKAAKAKNQAAAANENADFIRENNLVVKSMGRHVQCVLNFLPNSAEDGGTLMVPKFHTYLPEFCREYAHLRKPLPWVQFPPQVEALLLQRAHRIPMREGSVLIWDQRVAHGTAPNQSSVCRMAQYLKAFLRSEAFPVTPIQTHSQTLSAVAAGGETEHGGDGHSDGHSITASAAAVCAAKEDGGASSCDGSEVRSPQGAVSERLRRRSEAVHQLLVQHNARDLVTPLGETLFGLDIL